MHLNRLTLSAIGLSALALAAIPVVHALAGDIVPTTLPSNGPVKITIPGQPAGGDASTQPTGHPPIRVITPATRPAAKVSADAKTELDALSDAYNKLTSLDLAGTLNVNFDVDGEQQQHSAAFSSSFQAPNKFRHEMKDDTLLGSAGDKTYAYSLQKKIYLQVDAPKTKADFSKSLTDISSLVRQQNPSLFLALSDKPGENLTTGVTDVTKVDDTKIGDKSYTTLLLQSPAADTRVIIDPATHLVRQTQMDLTKKLKADGAENVKVATATFDYSSVVPNAPVKSDQFAWTPPEGAKDASQIRKEMLDDEEAAAKAIVGKPAPAFELTGTDGKKIDLASLKGHVVVIDFWATWCPPCRAELPNLDKLYTDKKGAGLKMFAIDLQEEKDDVLKAANELKFSIPILLDSDGKVAETYGVQPIPQTVLIGKDGVVKKVNIGYVPEEFQDMSKAVDAELAAK